MKVVGAEFLKSGTSREHWPPDDVPEIAFVGRSNVGKSSMLNKLSNRTGLARVSKTPGRTRALNFFDITLERAGTREIIRFCDLPGYGFAKVSKDERKHWAAMIEEYLASRTALAAVVSILDAYVGPTPDDGEMIDWLHAEGRVAIVVATKLDRLPKAKRAGRLRQLEAQLKMPPRSMLGFSSEEGFGKDELWGRLLEAAHRPPVPDEQPE